MTSCQWISHNAFTEATFLWAAARATAHSVAHSVVKTLPQESAGRKAKHSLSLSDLSGGFPQNPSESSPNRDQPEAKWIPWWILGHRDPSQYVVRPIIATRPKWHPRRSPHPWVPEISQDVSGKRPWPSWVVGNAGSFLWLWEEGIQKNGQLKWENADEASNVGYPLRMSQTNPYYGLSLSSCIWRTGSSASQSLEGAPEHAGRNQAVFHWPALERVLFKDLSTPSLSHCESACFNKICQAFQLIANLYTVNVAKQWSGSQDLGLQWASGFSFWMFVDVQDLWFLTSLQPSSLCWRLSLDFSWSEPVVGLSRWLIPTLGADLNGFLSLNWLNSQFNWSDWLYQSAVS